MEDLNYENKKLEKIYLNTCYDWLINYITKKEKKEIFRLFLKQKKKKKEIKILEEKKLVRD